MLALFLVFQLALDVVLVFLLLAQVRRRKAAPPASQWHQEFLLLAEDILAVVEPVLDALESGRLAEPPVPAQAEHAGRPRPAVSALRRRQALALLRAGAAPEDVARRGCLLPAELRLIRNLMAAEAELADPRQA